MNGWANMSLDDILEDNDDDIKVDENYITDEDMLVTSTKKYDDCITRMKKGWTEEAEIGVTTTWEDETFKTLVKDYCHCAHLKKHSTTETKLKEMQDHVKKLSDYYEDIEKKDIAQKQAAKEYEE